MRSGRFSQLDICSVLSSGLPRTCCTSRLRPFSAESSPTSTSLGPLWVLLTLPRWICINRSKHQSYCNFSTFINFKWCEICDSARLQAIYCWTFKQSLPSYVLPQHPVWTGHSLCFWKICLAFLTSCNMQSTPADGEATSSVTGPWCHFHIPLPLGDSEFSFIYLRQTTGTHQQNVPWLASKYIPEQHWV